MKNLRALAICLNLLIIIGAGHGVGPLGLFEYFSVSKLLTGEFSFNIKGRYNERLMSVAILSLVGQLILIFALIFSKKVKSSLTVLGCLILLTSIFILTQDSSDLNLDMISLIFSVPSIATAMMLMTVETKEIFRK